MKRILALFIFIVVILPSRMIAGGDGKDSALHTKVAQWMNSTGGLRFLENKGQMMDEQRKPVNNVLYKTGSGGMDVYVTNTGLSYVFVKLEKHKKKGGLAVQLKFKQHNDSITETYCRADMNLVGASIKKENIIEEGESTDRSDYYYGDICPNGILGVHSYEKITIKNIYPGIDWVLQGGKQGLKYNFIVHPGADPSQIKLKYKWTDAPQLQADGSIKISTPMGNITEGTPVSYCSDAQVPTAYSIQDSEIHFNVGNYNSEQTLVIDPVLVWATYYGSGAQGGTDVWSMQDDGTSVWLTGVALLRGFPTYNPGRGAYFQDTTIAGEAIFILQFNTAGVLKWATYYGGSGGNYGGAIYSDGNNVWLTGWASSTDFPTLNPGNGAYFQATPGAMTPFILKFNTAGVRKWATFYGGAAATDIDIGESIQSDGKNVWLTGYTGSPDFPTLNPGGKTYFQGTLAAGDINAFILKFDTAGVRKWATYYGGNDADGGDGGKSIQSDGKNVWVTGYTSSTNFPTLNPGGGAYFQGTFASDTGYGYTNAFILEFNTAGVRKWATYYGGNTLYTILIGDMGSSIFSDGKDVWVTGVTNSTNFPTLNPGGGAYYQGTITSKYGDVFISQFDTSGVNKWATYYGGSGDSRDKYGDFGLSIQSDKTNVWVGGFTSSTDFPTLSSCGFYQDTSGVNPSQDAFILQFSTTGVRKWATYYGADVEDDGSYVWGDGKNLFVAGDALTSGYPTVNPGGGAYFDDSAVSISNENAFIGKFNIVGLSVSSPVSICRGGATTLNGTGALAYNWSPPTGLSATNIPNPIASPTITTTYTVTGIDTGACGGTFVDSVKVIVDTIAGVNVSKDTSICSGSSVTLNASGGTNYTWSNGASTSSITIANISSTQIDTVSVSNGACKKDTTVKVTVVSLPRINLSGSTKVCAGDSVQLNVSGGNTYKWSNGNTTSTYYTSSVNTVTTITVTAYNSLGCPHDTSITITPDVPILSACCNTTILAGDDTMLIANGNTTKPYEWSPQVNCLNPLCDSVKVSPTVTTTYTVTMTDSAGCQLERVVTIVVDIPCSDFIVPNVFTPDYAGLAGLNNVFYINVNNTTSWSIIIYDRWGKEMFQSTNPTQYWDGNTGNGGKAPAGVYYYIINATCQSTSYKKDGFVQLIR